MAKGWGTPRTTARGDLPGTSRVLNFGTCRCGHLVAGHDIRENKTRGKCLHAGPKGACPCAEAEVAE